MRPVEYTNQLSILNKADGLDWPSQFDSSGSACEFAKGEVKMRDSQFSNGANASAGSSRSEATAVALPPADDDAGILTLEMQFNALLMELLAAQKASGELATCPDQHSLVQNSVQAVNAGTDHEARTRQVEAILARLSPIEQAIMATPALTIVGLGVKARHAAYVMSEYWDAPIDRIDWDARAVRLLIEAVCNVAHVRLPLCEAAGDAES
jgi:hypothetical protein